MLEEETVVGRAADPVGTVLLLIADRVDEISGVLSGGPATDSEDRKTSHKFQSSDRRE